MSDPDIRARALAALARAYAPPPVLRPSEWVESNVVLPPGSAMPGKFRFDQTPYFRQPFDDLAPDSPVRKVVIVAGAQVGKTQLLLNALAFRIATDPRPLMAVWPTEAVAKRLVITRIDPLFALIPSVKERLIPERSRERGNSLFLKKLIGGSELIIVGANAPAPLRSSPVDFVLLDEVSAYPLSTDEGDVLDLVEERQNTYEFTSKTLAISTPLDEGLCLITWAYGETDQRKYFVPCLQCNHRFVIEWSHIQWPNGKPELAALVCPECGRPHDDFEKPEQLQRGEWRATAEGSDPGAAGYHPSRLYFPWLKYAKIARRWQRVHKDPARLRVFTNATLAQTWKTEDGENLQAEGLPARRVDHGGVLPADTLLVTCGVDCQDDRLEVSWVAWHADERSTVFRHVILPGDPSGRQLWADLDDPLRQPIPHALAIPDMVPRAVAIDSGGHFTSAVYDFTRPRFKDRIFAIKGRGGPGVPIWPKRPYRANKARTPVYIIGVDQAKRTLYDRLTNNSPGTAGYIGFDASLPDSYFAQLTAERRVKRYAKGREFWEWKLPDGKRNEALDCAVYAYAALHALYSMGLDLTSEALRLTGHPLRTAAAAPIPQPVRHAPRRVSRSRYLENRA